jgi:hypothetical protein
MTAKLLILTSLVLLAFYFLGMVIINFYYITKDEYEK